MYSVIFSHLVEINLQEIRYKLDWSKVNRREDNKIHLKLNEKAETWSELMPRSNDLEAF